MTVHDECVVLNVKTESLDCVVQMFSLAYLKLHILQS